MKILHVIPYFAPAWAYGGTPRAVYEIALQQRAAGHEVTVLTTDAFLEKERYVGEEVISGITVYRVKNLSNFLCWKLHFVTPTHLPTQLLKVHFDVVHLHEVRTLLNYLALLQIRARRFVLSPWGTLPVNDRFVFVKKAMDSFLLPQLQKKVNTSFAQNKHEKEVLSEYKIGAHRQVIPLGVDTSFFETLPSKRESRKHFVLKENFCFLFLGRYSPVKGIDVLLQAAAILRKRGKKFSLLLVGRDDGFLPQMETLIENLALQNTVSLHGPLYEKERLLAYRASDCFVSVPTVYEETSTTCLESLLSSRPVITSNYSQIPFLRKQDGVIHTTTDPSEIANKMEEVMKVKPQINVSRVSRLFNWKNVSKEFEKHYVK